MKIGYQGIVGSNSEYVAKVLAERMQIHEPVFVPLTSSLNVIGQLKRKEIDYGVLAVKNSIGGTVQETFDMIKTEYIEIVATEVVPIHQSLFKKDASISFEDITSVASHVQALKQTEKSLQRIFGESIKKIEIADTALAAKKLSEGSLPSSSAVVCRKNAGEYYGLTLIEDNIEDSNNNQTEFRLYKMSEIGYSGLTKPRIIDRFFHSLFCDAGIGYLTRIFFVAAIFISLIIGSYFNADIFDLALTIGGEATVLFMVITSKKVRHFARYRGIVGYWKYYSFPRNLDDSTLEQRYDTPRIVQVTQVGDTLYFKGWICDKSTVLWFHSTKVVVTNAWEHTGSVVYWYENPDGVNRDINLGGVVVLEWDVKHPEAVINKMTSWYSGQTTGEMGKIDYLRITQEEFNRLQNNDYL
ncbi:hypothetical protein FACS1894217_02080 [Clostridia bacterium]|nr:hypothetical protein FACS1894217_02080 [Clostridia bacterium]